MAKATTSKTTQPTSMPRHAIQHIEITTPEPAKLRKFLEANFGWAFVGDADYAMFRTEGAGGGVGAPQKGQPVAAVPYINVDDAQAIFKKCEKAGATIVVPMTDMGGTGRYFAFSYAGSPPLGCYQGPSTA